MLVTLTTERGDYKEIFTQMHTHTHTEIYKTHGPTHSPVDPLTHRILAGE